MWGGENGLWESDLPVNLVNLMNLMAPAGVVATVRERLDSPAAS